MTSAVSRETLEGQLGEVWQSAKMLSFYNNQPLLTSFNALLSAAKNRGDLPNDKELLQVEKIRFLLNPQRFHCGGFRDTKSELADPDGVETEPCKLCYWRHAQVSIEEVKISRASISQYQRGIPSTAKYDALISHLALELCCKLLCSTVVFNSNEWRHVPSWEIDYIRKNFMDLYPSDQIPGQYQLPAYEHYLRFGFQ